VACETDSHGCCPPGRKLWKGLELLGFDRCQTTANDAKLHECFRAHYRLQPIVNAKNLGDILKMQHPEGAEMFLKKAYVDAFLLAVYFKRLIQQSLNK